MFYKCVTLGGYDKSENKALNPIIFAEDTTVIPGWCFAYCHELSEVKYPSSLQLIEDYAFYECNMYLKEVKLPDGCEVLGEHAFQQCTSLTTIYLSASMETIKSYAFYGCINIQEIVVPQGVKIVSDYAFAECYELTTIKIPSSVTYIGRGALYGCVKLESIFLPFVGAYKGGSRDDASLFGYIFGGLNDTYIAADGSINNMTYVQSNASSFWQFEQRYYNVRSFDSNFAPIAITEEDESKELHSTLYYVPKTLKTVNITNETVFGYGAFMNCDWLQNFYYHYIDYSDYNFAGNYSAIPDEQVTTITKIDDYAFFNMGGLLGSSFQRNGNKQTSAIALHDEASTNNTYGFFGTEEYIGDYAFALIDNENFINLVLPASLTYIGKYSFSNCANLESVSVKSNILGTYTFGYSPKLKNVIFNSDIETLDEGVFFECKQLFNIELTDKIKYINDYAFYNCDSLGTLNSTGTIDLKSVEHLGSYAFSDCDSLINITIPNSVIKILSHTFEHCIYLEKITLQNACMGSYMFAFNDSLETVSIPSSIVKIEGNVGKNFSKV